MDVDYRRQGKDWGYRGNDRDEALCRFGSEQSPIDLTLEQIDVSDKMEINGYGYVDFTVTKQQI